MASLSALTHPILGYRNYAADGGAVIDSVSGGTYTGEDNLLDADLSTYMEITAGGPEVTIDLGRSVPVSMIFLLMSSGYDNPTGSWDVYAGTSTPLGGGSTIANVFADASPDLADYPDSTTRAFKYYIDGGAGGNAVQYNTVRYVGFRDGTSVYTDPVRLHYIYAGPVMHNSAHGSLPNNGGAVHAVTDQSRHNLKANGSDFVRGGQVRRRVDFKWRFLPMTAAEGTARALLLAQQNAGTLEDGVWLGYTAKAHADYVSGFVGRVDIRGISPHGKQHWEAEGSVEERL